MPLTEPISVDFGVDGNISLDKFVYENILTLKAAFQDLHENKIPKWRRLAKGIPKDKVKEFPWPGASNTAIQLIGENIDILKAIQIGSIYEVLPIWVAGLVGDWLETEKGEEQRRVYEDFMDLMALSKDELDLMRVESLAANDIGEFGMVVVKAPWITNTEAIVIGINSEDRNKPNYEEKIIYDGPRPEKLNIQEWAATPTANTFKDADFKYHGPYKLKKWQIEEKFHSGAFDDNDSTRKILGTPDRQGLDTATTEQLQDQNITGWNPNENTAEWDFYECWFKYTQNNVKYSLIYTMHYATKTRMKAIFNIYADNDEPFEFGRLGYTDDGIIGYGLAEMGEMYQEQVSTQHNTRNDHELLQNTSIILTGTSYAGMRIDSGFSITPMACLPFHPDDFDIKQLGGPQPVDNLADEQFTIALAKARFGTDLGLPSGTGSGITTKGSSKSGPQYSAQGTFALMQTGTRRVNINVTDFRYLHLGLGNKMGRQYADFGVGDERLRKFGTNKPLLIKALQSIKFGKLALPIKAATASINREVEKQTGMLFVQVMERHIASINQAAQAIMNPMMKDMPEFRELIIGGIQAQAYIMTKLIRAFGYDNISRMQPELRFIEQIRSQSNANGQRTVGNNQETSRITQGEQSISEISPEQGTSENTFAIAGMENVGGVLRQ